MKFYTIIFTVLLCPLLSFSQENMATIHIDSNPSNIEIRINSVIVGKTPIRNYKLPAGTHLLEGISIRPGIWNITNVEKTIHLKAGQDTTIFINFPKSVKINSIPYHAKLIHQNKIIGKTPITIMYDKNYGKEFRLEKTGYQPFTFVLENQESKVYHLEKIDLSQEEQESSFTYDLFHKRTKSKFLFLTGSVVAHWLAFYFKNKADDRHDKYLSTGNPALMDKYWDETRRFDLYSDISIGISYAFLGGLIYTVLWR